MICESFYIFKSINVCIDFKNYSYYKFNSYTELVNEYFDNSYFNEVFASYLFLPLRSPEDSNVKTCFWGHEYINCVKINAGQVIRLTHFASNIFNSSPIKTSTSMF